MIGKTLEGVYNSKLKSSSSAHQSSRRSLSKTYGYPCLTPNECGGSSSKSDFKVSDSSTGGKLPAHGPRRTVVPNCLLRDDFEMERGNFKVSKSLIMNYNAICSLASSQNSGYVFLVSFNL